MLHPGLLAKFHSLVEKGPSDECWPFQSKAKQPRVWYNNKAYYPRVIAYVTTNGPVPPGMRVQDCCGNRHCCNPAHLYAARPREFTKDINELRTYRMDLRQVITDNMLKDIQTEEDGKFIAVCDEIVGPNNGVGASGQQQHFSIPGGVTRDNYVDALTKLEDLDLNNGVVLMNRKTVKQFLKWDRSEIGGDLSQDLFKEGLTKLGDASIMGVKHIFTIKRNLEPIC